MESISENKTTGEKSETPIILRVIISVFITIIAIENASLAYIIYTLGLYREGRWVILAIYEGINTVPITALLVIFCLRWARGVISFGKIVEAGKKPTAEEAEKCVQSIYLFARNGAILFTVLYLTTINFSSVLLYKWHDFTKTEAIFHSVMRTIVGLNLGVIFYYAVKIIEQFRLDQAAQVLFSAGVYEWKHFRLSIRYKIFMVIFAVSAYLLCGAVLMGFTQTENAQRIRLQEDLNYWVNKGSGQGYMLEDKLSSNAYMVILSPTGEVFKGNSSDLSPDQMKEILAATSSGVINDYKNKKLIVYSPRRESGAIMVGIGFWGISKAVHLMTRNVIVVLIIVSLLLSMVATFMLVRDIDTPLSRVLSFLRAISRGGTERVLKAYSEDEMGDFARELARTTALLETRTNRANELLERIKDAASAIEENVAKVQIAGREQAMGVNEQASAVEEALSASNEIVATARQISENADEVQKTAEQNLLSCKVGDERVAEALEGFMALGEYVEEISKGVMALGNDIRKMSGVVEIIEEVAIQINLLALNAQIESAGAGEAGKRFEVVAEEVRRLAESTMDAVKRIGMLVSSTLQATDHVVQSAQRGAGRVEKGAELADSVGNTFKEIQKQADSTELVARKIAIITSQQKTASEQMADTISGVHTSAQQIKESTENVLTAMAKLSETADRLALSFSEDQIKNHSN